jgi:agmatine deiminase
MTCSDKDDTYHDLLSENLHILKSSVDQDNNPLKIVEVEMSKKRFIPGDDEPSSYINFYIANSAIILPFFGDDVADQNAMKIIKEQFPNRQIECLNGHDILMGGGNIHCITQQQPKAIS